MAHPDPSVISHGLRALMVIVVARQRAGIALMKVLPAPEQGRPGHLHSEEGMLRARAGAKLDR